MTPYRLKTYIVHGDHIVCTTRKVEMFSTEEILEMQEVLRTNKSKITVAKDGSMRGLAAGSRAGDGNKASGKFTQGVRRAMQRCVDIFFMRAPVTGGINPATGRKEVLKAAMHTLTIPGGAVKLTAKEFKKLLLHPYLKTLQEQYGVTSYVYGAEFHTEGENAGQIHVHLFVDRYIPKAKCKARWWDLLDKAGLSADYYRRGKDDRKQGCHIEGIKSSSGLQWYLQKYLIKSRQKQGTTEGHWWGASAWIKKAKLPTFEPAEKTEYQVYKARDSKNYYYTDVYIDKDTKEMLFNEEGYSAPGAKKLMTIVRGNYDKDKKSRASVLDLLSPGDRKIYQAFVTAYRQCNWEWTELAAADLPQILRQAAGNDNTSSIYKIVKDHAAKLSKESNWSRYVKQGRSNKKIPRRDRSRDQGTLPLS